MTLELLSNCEYCDKDLPPNSAAARICTFECSFCADCAEGALRKRPSELRRWIRSAPDPAGAPVADRLVERVRLSYRPRKIAEFVAGVVSLAPENR
jgi:hypothetical protein